MVGKCNREPGKTVTELEKPAKTVVRHEMQKEKPLIEKDVNQVSKKKRITK